MRRSLRSLTVAATLGLSFGACADSTAPAAASPEVAAPDLKVTVDWMAPDSTSADFTVTPSGGVFKLGPHFIYFPANSICDPARSTYGAGEWDRPCHVLRDPIAIHAEVRKVEGHEWVDFTPSLRFVPRRDASKWVWIWMRTPAARDSEARKLLNILWSPGFGLPGIDESLDDPTLRTFVNPSLGVAYRRIKHFSGYQISFGIAGYEPEVTTRTGESF